MATKARTAAVKPPLPLTVGQRIPVLIMTDIIFELAVELEIRRVRGLITQPEYYMLKRCFEVVDRMTVVTEALQQIMIRKDRDTCSYCHQNRFEGPHCANCGGL